MGNHALCCCSLVAKSYLLVIGQEWCYRTWCKGLCSVDWLCRTCHLPVIVTAKQTTTPQCNYYSPSQHILPHSVSSDGKAANQITFKASLEIFTRSESLLLHHFLTQIFQCTQNFLCHCLKPA